MEGRWLIRALGPRELPVCKGPRPETDTPVVPCDDAAVRRAFDAVHDGFDIPADTVHEIVSAALRAAGETP